MLSLPSVALRSRRAWGVLIGVLTLEAFGGLALLVPIVTGMFGAGDEPIGPRLSIFLAALIAWVWVCITLLASLRVRASWVRASAITMHVLIFAAGTGVLQMGIENPLLGWGLVVIAFVGFFAALMARPNMAEVDSAEFIDPTDRDDEARGATRS